jgi:hypothetical protein
MRSSVFCNVTQRTFVITYISGQPIGPETSVTANLGCVTSYKGEDLIRTAAYICNHANIINHHAIVL